jgi:hypothetical protein
MSNWPNNTDLSKPNWTGRTARESNKYSRYSRPDTSIQADEWFLMFIVLFTVFGFVPTLYFFMG